MHSVCLLSSRNFGGQRGQRHNSTSSRLSRNWYNFFPSGWIRMFIHSLGKFFLFLWFVIICEGSCSGLFEITPWGCHWLMYVVDPKSCYKQLKMILFILFASYVNGMRAFWHWMTPIYFTPSSWDLPWWFWSIQWSERRWHRRRGCPWGHIQCPRKPLHRGGHSYRPGDRQNHPGKKGKACYSKTRAVLLRALEALNMLSNQLKVCTKKIANW